jgi:hypothetical protein
MSDQLPYEETDQGFNDLPLPDENASWQKMKEMLDRDDDDSRIIPPVFLKSCLGWGMLLLVGLTIAWLVVRPERWLSQTTKAKQESSLHEVQKPTVTEDTIETPHQTSKSLFNKETTDNITEPAQNEKTASPAPKMVYSSKNNTSVTILPKIKKLKQATKLPIAKNNDLIKESPKTFPGNESGNNSEKNVTNKSDKSIIPDTSLTIASQQNNATPKDSIRQNLISQPVDSSIEKKTKSSQKKLIVAAGLGLQQQIPIAGQTTVPYSYYGRESSLADYIPSVFIQLQKEKKWFVMGEFRFGAAQSVKELSYNQNTKLDSSTMNVTMTTMRLKKTYYHQLPFSFNYYLKTNLSVGMGGMYSHFYGAVTEKETDTWNAQTQTNTNFKEIIHIKHFTDSFLYKTQVHFLVQADYQWKRFSFGLRYTNDIQPYIKYTKPDGTVDEEKNQSLQLMIRYKLWQSPKL